jgi:hypothetical protein
MTTAGKWEQFHPKFLSISFFPKKTRVFAILLYTKDMDSKT